MILILIGILLSVNILLLLYCCVRINTPYDRTLDDQEQEAFLREYMRKMR